jgi:hypothetical protein
MLNVPTWSEKCAADFRIDTEEQARNWVLELVQDVELARDDCNIVFPDDRARTVEHQRKSYRRFLVKHGSVLGVLLSLHRCGKLGDRAYSELRQRALNTLGRHLVGDWAHSVVVGSSVRT